MSFKKQFLKSKPVCKVTFKLSPEEAKNADSVKLLGDFNEWDTSVKPMKKLKSGGFTATVDLAVEKEYEFKYLLDESEWENDWNADKYVSSETGSENSVVAV